MSKTLLRLVLIPAAVLVLAVIAVFVLATSEPSPVSPSANEGAQPTAIPVEPSPSEGSPQPTITPVEKEILVFTEEEIQSKLASLIERARQSGSGKVEYARIELYQDKMLISAKGQAFGINGETEDMEVWFEARTVFASGKVAATGRTLNVHLEAEIDSELGKPVVEVKRFNVGKLPLIALGLSRGKITGLINGAIEAMGLELPMELESISIEDGKLILTGK